MTCTLNVSEQNYKQEHINAQNISNNCRLDTHTSLTACEGIKPDVVQMSTWSTSRLPVIDIPPSENVPLCVKTKQTILSTPNDSYIKTGEPAKVNLCSPTKDECLSHETRKLVGDMKTPPLCESLKQLEADCSVVEHDKSIEPSSSVPGKRKCKDVLGEIGHLDTKISSSTRYNTRSKSIEMQPDTPSPQLVITTTAKKAIKRAKVINISSMSDDSDSQNIRESKLGAIKGCRIDPKQLDISETVLGVGQLGIVHLGTYRGLLVACKSKRYNTHQKPYDIQARRELEFAAKLSLCRYINKYLGWVSCPKHWVERSYVETQNIRKTPVRKFYMIQNYAADGDARSYLNKRTSVFQPQEVLQASICLFSALTDAHALNIGILDLKLENFLIDACGSGWLTDFGSCIEFKKKQVVKLDELNLPWTRNVASPEMLRFQEFSKASDVFMAIVIIAEMMTADLSDQEFSKQILHRNRSGCVSFSSKPIHNRYAAFFPLLEIGLSNEPTERPTAGTVLEYLVKMKN